MAKLPSSDDRWYRRRSNSWCIDRTRSSEYACTTPWATSTASSIGEIKVDAQVWLSGLREDDERQTRLSVPDSMIENIRGLADMVHLFGSTSSRDDSALLRPDL